MLDLLDQEDHDVSVEIRKYLEPSLKNYKKKKWHEYVSSSCECCQQQSEPSMTNNYYWSSSINLASNRRMVHVKRAFNDGKN